MASRMNLCLLALLPFVQAAPWNGEGMISLHVYTSRSCEGSSEQTTTWMTGDCKEIAGWTSPLGPPTRYYKPAEYLENVSCANNSQARLQQFVDVNCTVPARQWTAPGEPEGALIYVSTSDGDSCDEFLVGSDGSELEKFKVVCGGASALMPSALLVAMSMLAAWRIVL
mmetsp:Transcript_36255/g.85059  ORF Transcript_36255/g.85059 Transcript_36255/m.85059 type:complete len:169 (+) Transcript_36255:113-619(+)